MLPPATGAEIGRYRLISRLGAGGMGEVWEAELHGPGGFSKRVAIKLLRAGPTRPEARRALLQEAKLGAMLHHPNVVAVHGLEQWNDGWVIAMELVRGATLDELARSGPIPPRALIDIGVQACAGLAHIHALRVGGRPAGLVHRDIKLANLLVDQTGLVKVADLGAAGVTGDLKTVVGTPGYIAPEQWAGHAEARSDLFSLGVSLYRCATHRRPFPRHTDAHSAVQSIEAVTRSPDLAARVELAVPGLGEVLLRCLQPDPHDRWADAAALGEALGCLRRHQPDGPTLVELLAQTRPDLDLPSSTPSGSSLSQDRTVVLTTGNVPAASDAFFGREGEVEAICTRVRAGERLVTLLGAGGMGKTRLALQAARDLRSELEGGAWFFDLSEARSAAGICFAVARDLGLQLDRSEPVSQIGWALQSRGGALYVFDNLEQCVEHLPDTLARWLGQAPAARFLCTSRAVLGLKNERVERLGPLSEEEGVALFTNRTPPGAPAPTLVEVGGLVQDVEGMPLAIELAAARAGVFSVSELRAHLGPRLLSSRARDRPDRHRSIESSLAWSWDLLTDHGRAAMAQLSVCEGGFDLSAADAILDLPAEAGWALDVLTDLVDASMVRVTSTGRFSMLVVVQAFAAERLDDPEAARVRHGDWFAQLRGAAGPADLDNLVAACRRAQERGAAGIAAAAALGAWRVLQRTGPIASGIELLESTRASAPDGDRTALTEALLQALASAGRTDEAQAHGDEALMRARTAGDARLEAVVLHALGSVSQRIGHNADAIERFEAALELYRASGDRRREGTALGDLGVSQDDLGKPDAAKLSLEAALRIHNEVGNLRQAGMVLTNLGILHDHRGSLTEAREAYQEALANHRMVGDRAGEGRVLGNLGILASHEGDTDGARRFTEAALTIHRTVGLRHGEGNAHNMLANLFRGQGWTRQARHQYGLALARYREVGDRRAQSNSLSSLASVYAVEGKLDEARHHYEACLAINREIGSPRIEAYTAGNLGLLARDAGDIAEARVQLEAAIELQRAVGDRRGEGFYQGELGVMTLRHGDPELAGQLLDEAFAIFQGGEDRWSQAMLLREMGAAHLEQGHADLAARRLEAALDLLGQLDQQPDVGATMRHLAAARAAQGRTDEAERLIDEAATAHREGRNPREQCYDLDASCRLQLRAGDLAAARTRLDSALDCARSFASASENREPLGRVLCTRAELERAEGRADEARATVSEVGRLADELGHGAHTAFMKRVAEVRGG